MLLSVIQYSGHVVISCVVWKHSPTMMITLDPRPYSCLRFSPSPTSCVYCASREKVGGQDQLLLLLLMMMMLMMLMMMISAKVQMKRTQSWEARVSLASGLLPQNEPCLSEDMRAVTHLQIAVGLNFTPIPPSLIK